MNEITLPMAIVDFIPVVICAIIQFIFMNDFHRRMTSIQYALFSGGALMLVSGGFLKALWKLLYALELCDIQLLSEQLFTSQSMAFVFMSIGCWRMVTSNKKLTSIKLFSASAIPVVTSHVPFIIIMFLGMTCWYSSLVTISVRLKEKKPVIFIILSYVFMLVHSAIGTKFDNRGIMHWFAQFVNIGAQAFLLAGALSMHNSIDLLNYKEQTEGY